MSEHDSDKNPGLDEIESLAAVAARFWLAEAEQAIEEEVADAKRFPAGILGVQIAAAIHYQAERQVDAAAKIRDGLLAVADALQGIREPMQIERLAGIENELYRLANVASDAQMAGAFSSPKGCGDGGK